MNKFRENEDLPPARIVFPAIAVASSDALDEFGSATTLFKLEILDRFAFPSAPKAYRIIRYLALSIMGIGIC